MASTAAARLPHTEGLPVPAPASTRPTVNPPGKTYRYWFEDFPAGSSRSFGDMPVTREAVIAFASQFDPQPFHLDDEAAAATLFGRLSASGWHTCAMAMRMMCDGYLLDSASLGSPGIDHLRWLAPVFPGDTLHARMDVLEARPMKSRPHVGLVRSRWTLTNQDGTVVMTMEGWGMFRRRDMPQPGETAG
jgi:acyl dehydratase